MSDPFLWPIRVYYEDTDVGGVVYYANYLRFFERARTEMLRNMGYELDELIENRNVIFAVRSAQVDYIKPARFNDELLVSTEISIAKPASLVFEQMVSCSGDELCRGTIRIACLDTKTLKPKVIPKDLFKQLSK